MRQAIVSTWRSVTIVINAAGGIPVRYCTNRHNK